MNSVELFAGTKSFSKVAKKRGHNIFTVEINSKQNPDLVKDIFELQVSDLPNIVDVIWMSPPCTTFSVASLRYYWVDGRPKNEKTWKGISLVLKCLQLIEDLKKNNPNLIWFIENPRGMLRKQNFMSSLHRKTVTYCQYGDFRMKPTDIFTNLVDWLPRPMCKPGDSCHASAKRGSDSGTQNMSCATARSVIPFDLFDEIFEQLEFEKGDML